MPSPPRRNQFQNENAYKKALNKYKGKQPAKMNNNAFKALTIVVRHPGTPYIPGLYGANRYFRSVTPKEKLERASFLKHALKPEHFAQFELNLRNKNNRNYLQYTVRPQVEAATKTFKKMLQTRTRENLMRKHNWIAKWKNEPYGTYYNRDPVYFNALQVLIRNHLKKPERGNKNAFVNSSGRPPHVKPSRALRFYNYENYRRRSKGNFKPNYYVSNGNN
jgi:hypothetical protein